jgi:hypothetical protein
VLYALRDDAIREQVGVHVVIVIKVKYQDAVGLGRVRLGQGSECPESPVFFQKLANIHGATKTHAIWFSNF